jgi:RNA recognition motif-containing protein
MRTVYIGNLARSISDLDLQRLFLPYGKVNWCNIVRDKMRDISQGFGFVEMDSSDNAATAISGLHGIIFKGKRIAVNQAKPKSHL